MRMVATVQVKSPACGIPSRLGISFAMIPSGLRFLSYRDNLLRLLCCLLVEVLEPMAEG